MTKNDNKNSNGSKTNHMPLLFGYKALGYVVAFLFAGRILENHTP